MDKKPFASFCFSTFKRPHYLRSALQNVLLQTFKDFEVIISDNDVDESGKDVANSFNDPRIKYFPNGTNLGMKPSFNKSLWRSSGEFIIMIADDDPVYPDMLQTLYDLHVEYPGYGMYIGGCDWYCVDYRMGNLYNFRVGTNSCLSNNHDIGFKFLLSPADFLKQLYTFGIFSHYLWSTAIVKREILIEAGGVPDYGTAFLGDYAYMSVCGSFSGCVMINKSLGCQTLHNENYGRNQNDQLITVAKNFPEYLKGKLSFLAGWEEIQKRMIKFIAIWLVLHMAFLKTYYKKTGNKDGIASLREAEINIFKLKYMKKYRVKYILKTSSPRLHDYIVQIKKKFKTTN